MPATSDTALQGSATGQTQERELRQSNSMSRIADAAAKANGSSTDSGTGEPATREAAGGADAEDSALTNIAKALGMTDEDEGEGSPSDEEAAGEQTTRAEQNT